MPANSVPGTGSSRPADTTVPVGFGDPQLHAVIEREPAQQRLGHGCPVGHGVPEGSRAHRGHGADVALGADPPQRDSLGERDLDRQALRRADHDRLRFLGGEAVGEEALVQSWRMVVPTGLPLHASDLGIRSIVRQCGADQPIDLVSTGAAEVLVGDEAAATGELHQPQRSERVHRDRARCLRIGPQLLVVRREEPAPLIHAGHGRRVPVRAAI